MLSRPARCSSDRRLSFPSACALISKPLCLRLQLPPQHLLLKNTSLPVAVNTHFHFTQSGKNEVVEDDSDGQVWQPEKAAQTGASSRESQQEVA